MRIRHWLTGILLFALLFCASALAESLALPEDTRVIEAEAFRGCAELTGTIVIPDSVEEIGEYAFAGCSGFTGVPVIGAGVISIGAHAFDGCAGLSGTLYLAEGVAVDETAFANCPDLQVIRGEQPPIARVAVILDGPIAGGDFNAMVYSAAQDFCAAQGLDFRYYEANPEDETGETYSLCLQAALADACDVLILPGFTFAELIASEQANYPDVRFIGLDITGEDVGVLGENVFCASYREEQAGFLAGYAAVKLGYRRLGFAGGFEIPAVVRFGHGFVQGADVAAAELNATAAVEIEYTYANVFWPDDDLEAEMKDWYRNDGVEVVFGCGGKLCESVVAAAQQTGGKFIGVDADQAETYGTAITVTSAMKGLGATIRLALGHIVDGTWAEIGGSAPRLGLTGAVLEENHVQLPASTQFGSGFTRDDYTALVANILNGTYVVSDATDAMPAVDITVNVR